MKKNVLKIVATLLSVCVFACFFACSGASGGKNATGDYYAYAPSSDNAMYEEGSNYKYGDIIENDFVSAAEKASSTFSLDRNTAGYSLMRAQINRGLKIAENSVRLEEYVNYFSYDYEKPTGDDALKINAMLGDCPWNSDHKLFTVGVAAKSVDFSENKQNNLVFLLDVSGSMFGDDRLGLVQQAFTQLAENLSDDDFVSIVVYASNTRVVAEGLRGYEKVKIANILQDLSAGGSTAGGKGIQLAYQAAEKYFIKGGNNRVLLATDGDFNVGLSSNKELKDFISQKRQSGIYLSVMGFGMGNTRDDLMETLARNGNGNYGYIDSLTEARKMLVSEMGGTLEVVAKDAKINVTFNSENVEKYRLLGYESKMITQEEFENEATDAGEIGSGHTVTAVYEIELKDGVSGELAQAEIRYKTPGDLPEDDVSKSVSETFDCSLYSEECGADFDFIGCVAEYALMLRNSKYRGTASFGALIERLKRNETVYVSENSSSEQKSSVNEFRSEFLQLAEKAAELYADIENASN